MADLPSRLEVQRALAPVAWQGSVRNNGVSTIQLPDPVVQVVGAQALGFEQVSFGCGAQEYAVASTVPDAMQPFMPAQLLEVKTRMSRIQQELPQSPLHPLSLHAVQRPQFPFEPGAEADPHYEGCGSL